MRSTKLLVSVVVLGVVCLSLSNIAIAGKKVTGKELYKEYCKPCHLPDSPNGEYTPMTLIQDQWERFFKDKYEATHKDVVDDNHEGGTVTDVISDENLAKIKKFAIDHAADSEHPMTCG